MAHQISSCIPQSEYKTVDLDDASISAYKEPHSKKGDGFIIFESTDGKSGTWKYSKDQKNEFMVDMAMIQQYDQKQ